VARLALDKWPHGKRVAKLIDAEIGKRATVVKAANIEID